MMISSIMLNCSTAARTGGKQTICSIRLTFMVHSRTQVQSVTGTAFAEECTAHVHRGAYNMVNDTV
jgi:hypothetical protein